MRTAPLPKRLATTSKTLPNSVSKTLASAPPIRRSKSGARIGTVRRLVTCLIGRRVSIGAGSDDSDDLRQIVGVALTWHRMRFSSD